MAIKIANKAQFIGPVSESDGAMQVDETAVLTVPDISSLVSAPGNMGNAGSAASYRLVAGSGNPLIDGLLSGVAWNSTNLTFAYPTSGADYGAKYAAGENNSFTPFTPEERSAADFARFLISDYTKITFTAAPAATANLRYGNQQDPGIHGYFPDGFSSMGDLWIGTKNNNQGTAKIGAFDFATILHEQGHTLGLKHGQDTGINNAVATTGDGQTIPNFAPLPAANDSWNYSVMTYRSYQGAKADPIQASLVSDNPTSYMISDIAALQYMYGANFSGSSSTNSVYSWDAAGNEFVNGALYLPAAVNGKIFETIWDGGGTDTYDTSNFGGNQSIDLRPGNFSTFDSAKLADLDKFNPGTKFALGNVGNALQFQGDPRSLIENATTGSGNDTIIGNAANNSLRGNAGNDQLNGGGGDDTLDGGDGVDTAVFSGTKAQYTITNANNVVTVKDSVAGRDGTDTLTTIERIAFSDGVFDIASGVFTASTVSAASAQAVQTLWSTILRQQPTTTQATADGVRLDTGTTKAAYTAELITKAAPTTGAALLLFDVISGKTPDSAGLDGLTATAKSLVDAAGGNANASWQQLGASLTDSKFNTNYQTKYAALSNTDLIKALSQEVFGSAPSDFALGFFQNLITYYQGIYSQFADANDPTGLIRAKGTLIGDMLKQAMDANVGKYPAAEVTFLNAAANGTANYGADLFATKAAAVGFADPVPGDGFLM